jgi:hypothetical protein
MPWNIDGNKTRLQLESTWDREPAAPLDGGIVATN